MSKKLTDGGSEVQRWSVTISHKNELSLQQNAKLLTMYMQTLLQTAWYAKEENLILLRQKGQLVAHTCNPSFRKQRQEFQKIKVTLIYTVTSRSVWTTGDPVPKEGNKEWAVSVAQG